jgi:hypothetical protein
MVVSGGKRYGFEFKYLDAPAVTRSMRVAMTDLSLEHLWVIYPGNRPYALDTNISVIPIEDIAPLAASLRVG